MLRDLVWIDGFVFRRHDRLGFVSGALKIVVVIGVVANDGAEGFKKLLVVEKVVRTERYSILIPAHGSGRTTNVEAKRLEDVLSENDIMAGVGIVEDNSTN